MILKTFLMTIFLNKITSQEILIEPNIYMQFTTEPITDSKPYTFAYPAQILIENN